MLSPAIPAMTLQVPAVEAVSTALAELVESAQLLAVPAEGPSRIE